MVKMSTVISTEESITILSTGSLDSKRRLDWEYAIRHRHDEFQILAKLYDPILRNNGLIHTVLTTRFDNSLLGDMLLCSEIQFDMDVAFELFNAQNICDLSYYGRLVNVIKLELTYDVLNKLDGCRRLGWTFPIHNITTSIIDPNQLIIITKFLKSEFNDIDPESITIIDYDNIDDILISPLEDIIHYFTKMTRINLYVISGYEWCNIQGDNTTDMSNNYLEVYNVRQLLRTIQYYVDVVINFSLMDMTSDDIEIVAKGSSSVCMSLEFTSVNPLEAILLHHMNRGKKKPGLYHIEFNIDKVPIRINIQLYKDDIIDLFNRVSEDENALMFQFIRANTPNLLPKLNLTSEQYNSLTDRERERFGIRGSSNALGLFKITN